MPAALEHLLTGRRALEVLRPASLPLYYLGCVAPDAPNLDGFASKEIRWSAHLRREDPEDWIRHALKWAKEKEGNPSLRMGYAVHIIGDAVWDLRFEKGLQKAVKADGLSREERFQRRWNEHYRFEQEQLQEDWWIREVRPLLAQAEPEGINGLSAEQLRRLRDHLVTDYAPAPQGETVGYVTPERIAEFQAQVAKCFRENQ